MKIDKRRHNSYFLKKYDTKMIDHINRVTYKLLDYDLTIIIINKLNREAKPILRKSTMNQSEVCYLYFF